MDNLRSITLELETWVCASGYEVKGVPLSRGGIVGQHDEPPKTIPAIVPREPNNIRKQTIEDQREVDQIWRELVRIANLRRVARPLKINRLLESFCGKYGLPSKGLVRLENPVQQAFTADIFNEIGRMADAIRAAAEGFVSAPDDVIDAVERDKTFRFDGTGGDMYLTFTNPLIAGWIVLIGTRVHPDRVCEFCGGVNVSRAGSVFCSDYCRDRHHKKMRRKGKQ